MTKTPKASNDPHLRARLSKIRYILWLRGASHMLYGVILATILNCSLALAVEDIALPVLGDSGAGLMSSAEEHALGQAWLRSFRAGVPLNSDPLIFEYLEHLLFQLASQSEIDNPRLDLVLVDNPTINAFAVPGGVVGVHTGLITSAQTEAQLASVLAHELAHLSQRHFARSVEAAKRANVASIAGMLAGIILAATAGGDAATAAIATSQAVAIDSRLRYSRIHEREADRIGMQTLVNSGYPANAAANMFRQMQDASRLYGEGIPEFLRTHPVTESRIADAENRARTVEAINPISDIDYQIIRARVAVLNGKEPKQLVKKFKFALEQSGIHQSNTGINKTTNNTKPFADSHKNRATVEARLNAARYGLAMAYNKNGQWKKARATIQPMLQQLPGRIAYSLLDIEIDLTAGKLELAEKRLRDLYAITPNNYAISMLLADTLLKNKNYATAQQVLEKLSKVRPKQADVWYLLAETQGLAGDILNLHLSRAEFFLLRGNFLQARKQLNFALKIAGNDFQISARIKQRLLDTERIRQITEQL